jgi:hypothetical protein
MRFGVAWIITDGDLLGQTVAISKREQRQVHADWGRLAGGVGATPSEGDKDLQVRVLLRESRSENGTDGLRAQSALAGLRRGLGRAGVRAWLADRRFDRCAGSTGYS